MQLCATPACACCVRALVLETWAQGLPVWRLAAGGARALPSPPQSAGPSFPSMPLTPLLCPLSLSVAATTLVEVREEDDSCLRTMASFASFHPAAAARSLVRIDALAIDGWAPAFHTSDLCQLLVVTTELQALKITNTNHFNRTPA